MFPNFENNYKNYIKYMIEYNFIENNCILGKIIPI